MKTILLSVAKGYTLEEIKPWANSLKRSGYRGATAVILYDNNPEIAEYLSSIGILIYQSDDRGLTHIGTQRFQDYSNLLQTEPFKEVEYVIHADIRDIIFQSNPEEWLIQNIEDAEILSSSEGITFRHEDWNGEGIQQNFGLKTYLSLEDEEILCSGVIAGKRDTMIHLFTTLFELAFYTHDLGSFADQNYYNLAIRKIYKGVTKVIPADAPWVANLSTLIAIPLLSPEWSTGSRTPTLSYERFRKSKTFAENMKTEPPLMVEGKVCTPGKIPYCIVHQYDRYAPWKEILLSGVKDFTIEKRESWLINRPIENFEDLSTWPSRGNFYLAGLIPLLQNAYSRRELVFAEVGVLDGENTAWVLRNLPNIKTYYVIESWSEGILSEKNSYVSQEIMDHQKSLFFTNTQRFEPKIEVVNKDSISAAEAIQEDVLDVVFINNAISRESIHLQIPAYWKKIKNGGLISGYDWRNPSVQEAVYSFMKENGLHNERLIFFPHNCWGIGKI